MNDDCDRGTVAGSEIQRTTHFPFSPATSYFTLATMTFDPMQLDDTFTTVDMEDLLETMRRQERSTYRRNDYLSQGQFAHIVDGSWRQRIVEWMFGVVDTCGLRRDSVAIAAYYLDLCVERDVIDSRQEFQLAAMTALQLAIKLYDSTVMKLDSMVKLGRGLFTENDVINMETKILKALKWQVHPPTPVCYLRQYLRLLPSDVSPLARYIVGEVTRFIAEISVCIYKFVKYPPSVIAYAGMLIAMERIDESELHAWERERIYASMAQVAEMDHKSDQVVSAVAELHASLDKNVSIQELINTIDAQCHDGFQKMCIQKYARRYSGPGHSPRDVRSTRRV